MLIADMIIILLVNKKVNICLKKFIFAFLIFIQHGIFFFSLNFFLLLLFFIKLGSNHNILIDLQNFLTEYL